MVINNMEKKIRDLLKEFEEKSKEAVSDNRHLWEGTDADDIYDVDIHIWRTPGMGNSLQTISGNKISIITATASYLNTLLSKNVITMKDFDFIVTMVKGEHDAK